MLLNAGAVCGIVCFFWFRVVSCGCRANALESRRSRKNVDRKDFFLHNSRVIKLENTFVWLRSSLEFHFFPQTVWNFVFEFQETKWKANIKVLKWISNGNFSIFSRATRATAVAVHENIQVRSGLNVLEWLLNSTRAKCWIKGTWRRKKSEKCSTSGQLTSDAWFGVAAAFESILLTWPAFSFRKNVEF